LASATDPWSGQTSVTEYLLGLVGQSPGTYDPSKAYTGGTGVLVRNPYDGYEQGGPFAGKGGAYEVLPATFLSNDIFAPNKVFPRFIHNVGFDWDSPVVVYVLGSAMKNMFLDFDTIQKDDWGWGVFYPWDSNAVDSRCEWLAEKGIPNIYNCPGYSKKFSDPHPTKDPNMYGAGYFKPGNPWANPMWGGGAGCHFSQLPYGCNDASKCANDIDQVNRYAGGDKKKNLVQDPSCQCNYIFKDPDWSHWVQNLGSMADDAKKGTLPEAAICWVNNIRDLINLANQLFWGKSTWFDSGELGSHGPAGYWGWNEIPMSRTGTAGITNPSNWDAVVIKMPLYVCGGNGGNDHLGCITPKGALNLETDLTKWVSDKLLIPGSANVANRPGSYIVLMREWKDKYGNSFSYFFCQDWASPNRKFEVVYIAPDGTDKSGACYLEKGVGLTESDLKGPFEEPVSRAKAKALHRLYTSRKPGNSTVVV